MINHRLCAGIVWHKRYVPKQHEFSYKLNSWLIDLQDLESLTSKSRLVNKNKWAIYRFRDKDYLRDLEGNSLLDKLKREFCAKKVTLSGDEKFFLLGQISNVGIYFSPLNLYICYKDDNWTHILAEVSNTPWNERHYYLLDRQKSQIINKKEFHVSPFFTMDQEYNWHIILNKNHISFRIDTYEKNNLVFSANYTSVSHVLSSPQARKIILFAPLAQCKILVGIYFEALCIWLKKIPYVPYPKSFVKPINKGKK